MENKQLVSLWIIAALACAVFFVGDHRAIGGTGGTGGGRPAPIPPKEVLKKKLTPEQYTSAQENGTEPPFANAYWNNHADGIYVDVVSGDPLFSSLDKFDSGSGWQALRNRWATASWKSATLLWAWHAPKCGPSPPTRT